MAYIPSMAELLGQCRDDLRRWVESHASGLLKHEETEDVVQGIHMRALTKVEHFQYQGDPQFFGWLIAVGRQYVADRHDYWSALRRQAGKILRVTVSGNSPTSTSIGIDPRSDSTGPGTFTERRELVEIAVRAASLLIDRDRQIVGYLADGLPNAEIAAQLGVSYDAAERAKRRAIERFRKTFELVRRHNERAG